MLKFSEVVNELEVELDGLKESIGMFIGKPRNCSRMTIPVDRCNSNTVVFGYTGSGKTVVMINMIASVLMNKNIDTCVELYSPIGIDELGVEGIEELGVPLKGYIGIDECIVGLSKLYSEAKTRYDKLVDANCKNIKIYNANNTATMAEKVVFIDEFMHLLDSEHRESVLNTIERILKVGAATGIYLVFSGHSPKGFPEDIMKHCINRVALRLDEESSMAVLGSAVANESDRRHGFAYFKNWSISDEVIECDVPFMNRLEFVEVLKKHAKFEV